ncbi:PEP-CTERM sorting domain-containing protein [Kiritimatiellaeota bacterium B1221]|nr:PEP-CTERM sorting domain-containing protein [Kiritimatiellaeota bacterium B1221]
MKISLLTILIPIVTTPVVHAALIDIDGSANEFETYSLTASNSNPAPWGSSSETDGDVTLSILNNSGSGLSWNNSWSSGSYDAGAEINTMQSRTAYSSDISADADEAMTENRYFTLQLSTTGSNISWDSVGVTLWRNGDGAPEFFQFAYDDEGLGYEAGDFLGSVTSFDTGLSNEDTVSFSSAGLPSNFSSDSVRLYFWGGTSGTGNFHITNIEAEYSVIPEPGSLALMVIAFAGLMIFCRRKG